MTNKKLPEVGKRYQEIANTLIVQEIEIVKPIWDYKLPSYKLRVESDNRDTESLYTNEFFLNNYEEIPEQEPTAENHIPDIRKKVDEVQKAKEELRNCVRRCQKSKNWTKKNEEKENPLYSSAIYRAFIDELTEYSEELIDALDAQEIAGSKLSKTVTLEDKSDEKEAQSILDAVKDVSKAEPEIYMEEERVDPIKTESIWKSTSDLPKIFGQVIIKDPYKKHLLIDFAYGKFWFSQSPKIEFEMKDIEEWSYFTDFVNQVQDNTNRLDKLLK